MGATPLPTHEEEVTDVTQKSQPQRLQCIHGGGASRLAVCGAEITPIRGSRAKKRHVTEPKKVRLQPSCTGQAPDLSRSVATNRNRPGDS
jgi:hypothetical protein